jgi:hypothetical protein
LTTPRQPKRNSFLAVGKGKVYQYDIGIAAVVAAKLTWTAVSSIGPAMALYGDPLIGINACLVLYAWLQHTNVDVPHFFGRRLQVREGCLAYHSTILNTMTDPWGIIDKGVEHLVEHKHEASTAN